MRGIPKEQVALTTCKRCGCPTVGWFTSTRTGKPYMVNVEAQPGRNGKLPKFGFAARNALHNCEDYTRYMEGIAASNRRAEEREQKEAAAVTEILDAATLVRENFTIYTDNMGSWPIFKLYYIFGKNSLGHNQSVYLTCDQVREDLQPVIEKYLSGEEKMYLKHPKKENPALWKLTEAGEAYYSVVVAPKLVAERRAAALAAKETE